ncbi:universal stress protein [Aromatoleum toluclasticum]|uniref:universal stress protein n=1 Tax=Aromatoleum toluclasticum TaxID=92003 RepID=UPI001D18C3F0|nr:universal stress protein [Aromatoleum toluclasticum]MCC4118785.1 universal stress protein [Aromatoleum toluclasticum]
MSKTEGYQRIVVAVAIEVAAHPALRRAVNVAERTNGSVTMVHALKPSPLSPDTARPAVVERTRSELEALQAGQPRIRGLRLVDDRPWTALVDIADETDADLVVIGSFVHGQLRALLGTNSDRVLHQARRDILVVRSDAYNDAHPPRDYTHIVAATDLTDHGRAAVERAAGLADAFRARLTLLNVMAHFPEDRENETTITPENLDPQQFQQDLRTEALARLAVGLRHPDLARQVAITTESVAHGVADHAREVRADLIVIGSRGSYGLNRLLGDTADEIMHRVPCDLLIVRG